MDKLITVLPFIVGVFIIVIWVLNPLFGPVALLVTAPLIVIIFLLNKSKQHIRTELQATVASFQTEKEEIIKEIQKKEKRLKIQNDLLTKFSKALSTALNKEQLLRLIVEEFAAMTVSAGANSQCFLLSHDPGTDEFMYEVGHNFDSNTLKSLRFKAGDELMSSVISAKKIYTYVSDIFGGDSNIRYFLKEDRVTYLSQLGSLALIPLILEDEVWGIIVIFCQEEAASRIKNEESFFVLLIAQASIALGSAIHRGLASVDRLTQLYNRTFLQKRMKEEFEFCNRQLLPMSIMMIDIDHFKDINDSYGHQEGDMVLKKIAQILSKNVRLTDLCARYGGEEFVVALPGIAEVQNDKFSIAERLRRSVEESEFFVLGDKRINVTISVGVTVRMYPDDKDQPLDELIRRADDLLYEAKREGRNKVCYPK